MTTPSDEDTDYRRLFESTFNSAPIGIAHVSPEAELLRVNPTLCEMLGYDAEELMDMHLDDITHPEDQQKEKQLLSQVLDGDRSEYTLRKRYITKEMDVLWGRVSVSAVGPDGQPPEFLVGMVEDISDRVRAERETEKLSTIVEIQRDVALSELDLEETINRVAEAAMTVTGATGSGVALAEGDTLIYRGVGGILENQLGLTVPVDDSLSGIVYRNDDMQTCPDTETHDRLYSELNQDELGFRSALVVPLSYENTTFGVVMVVSEVPYFFEQEDEDTIELLSGLLASQIFQSLKFQNTLLESRTDDLTGLNNRRRMMEQLQQEINRADRYENNLSLILLDLDHFKLINDDHGHVVGNDVLRTFGKILEEETRDTDFVGRYGGEEFLVITTETRPTEAVELAERVRARVAEHDFEDPGEEPFTVTVSGGVADYEEDLSPKTFIERADQALYRAKDKGRNQVCKYDATEE